MKVICIFPIWPIYVVFHTSAVITGILNREGKSYHPQIVRVGVNVHHSVQSISMDSLVNQRLQSLQLKRNLTAARMQISSGGDTHRSAHLTKIRHPDKQRYFQLKFE